MPTSKERLLDFLRFNLMPRAEKGPGETGEGYLLKLKRGGVTVEDVNEFLNLLCACPEIDDLNEDAELVRRLFFVARVAPTYWNGYARKNPDVQEKLVKCQRECGRIVGERFSKYWES